MEKTKAPILVRSEEPAEDKRFRGLEAIFLPLPGNGTDVDMIMVHAARERTLFLEFD